MLSNINHLPKYLRYVVYTIAAILVFSLVFLALKSSKLIPGYIAEDLFSGMIYCLVIAVSGLLCILRSFAVTGERWAWRLIGLGIM